MKRNSKNAVAIDCEDNTEIATSSSTAATINQHNNSDDDESSDDDYGPSLPATDGADGERIYEYFLLYV